MGEAGVGDKAGDRRPVVPASRSRSGEVAGFERGDRSVQPVGDILPLAWIGDEFAGDRDGVVSGRSDQGEVAAGRLVDPEVGVEVAPGVGVIGGELSGGEDDKILVGFEGDRGERPLPQFFRIIGEVPPVERDHFNG